MTENNEKKIDETEEVVADEINENESVTEAEAEQKASKSDKKKIKKLEGELEKKEAELSEANDKYMRLFAEYDNFRKRTAKEKEGIYADAYIDALSQILPVLDNLERAAAFENADAESLKKGLELTLKSFAETLEKMGVSEIEALGKEFDPNLHNAVMQVASEEYESGVIVQELQKGYTYRDSVVRHSMVSVAE